MNRLHLYGISFHLCANNRRYRLCRWQKLFGLLGSSYELQSKHQFQTRKESRRGQYTHHLWICASFLCYSWLSIPNVFSRKLQKHHLGTTSQHLSLQTDELQYPPSCRFCSSRCYHPGSSRCSHAFAKRDRYRGTKWRNHFWKLGLSWLMPKKGTLLNRDRRGSLEAWFPMLVGVSWESQCLSEEVY